MEKVIAGKITLFRERCPKCGEWNISGNHNFKCTWCDKRYVNQEKMAIRQLFPPIYKRKIFKVKEKKIVFKRQKGQCYWCGRLFGILYIKRGTVKKLKINMDHNIPFSFFPDDNLENIIGACSICNQFKSNKIFNNETECKNYLNYKWNRSLSNRKIIIEIPLSRCKLGQIDKKIYDNEKEIEVDYSKLKLMHPAKKMTKTEKQLNNGKKLQYRLMIANLTVKEKVKTLLALNLPGYNPYDTETCED